MVYAAGNHENWMLWTKALLDPTAANKQQLTRALCNWVFRSVTDAAAIWWTDKFHSASFAGILTRSFTNVKERVTCWIHALDLSSSLKSFLSALFTTNFTTLAPQPCWVRCPQQEQTCMGLHGTDVLDEAEVGTARHNNCDDDDDDSGTKS